MEASLGWGLKMKEEGALKGRDVQKYRYAGRQKSPSFSEPSSVPNVLIRYSEKFFLLHKALWGEKKAPSCSYENILLFS